MSEPIEEVDVFKGNEMVAGKIAHSLNEIDKITDEILAQTDFNITAEQLAQFFHETYEELAPSFGYETRKESAKPWAEVPEKNKSLMIAVCRRVLEHLGLHVE